MEQTDRLVPLFQKSASLEMHRYIRITSTAILLIGLPFYIMAAFKIFLNSQIEEFFIGLRYELSYNDADIGPLKYLMPFSYVVFAVNLYNYNTNRNKLNLLLLLIALLSTIAYAVFATGRTFFFMILIVYLGINSFSSKTQNAGKLLVPLSIFFLIFVTFGIVLGKGGRTENSAKENIQSSVEYLGTYLVASVNALDQELNSPTEGSIEGSYSIRFFMKVAMEIGIIQKQTLVEPPHPYAFVPYPTNVYTYYSPYIQDFGRLYSWIMLAVFSSIHTWLFNKAHYQKSGRAALYYTFLLFPLMLSFFSDLYLSLFSFWIQLAFFIEMIFFSNNLLKKLMSYRFAKG